jgi:3-oxoacyl-[acyl-carrier-protein] synthase II
MMSWPGGDRAAVTGIGLVTPLGRGVAEFSDALSAGRSGLREPPEKHPVANTLEVAGFAPDIEASSVLPPTETRCVDRFVLLALAAAADALADAGIEVGRDVDPYRIAVIAATGGGGLQTFEEYSHAWLERGRPAVSAYLLPGMLCNMAAARIAIKYQILGYSSAIVTACAAGAQAIAEGLRLIRDAEADVVICGGTDSPLHPTIAAAFTNARALARGWADPTAASRPFDRARNGFVLAEGAGMLVLERTAYAQARRAAAYADLAGWGATTDAHHPTMPRPDGARAAECMRRAIASAGLAAADVGYVNAHGTSTKIGDTAEAAAIRSVFGAGGPAVSSIKGVTGHLLGASGAVEAAATALAMAAGALPPTHNLTDPDPACDLDHVRGSARIVRPAAALSNSFAFGGHNLSLLFTPPGSGATRTITARGTR